MATDSDISVAAADIYAESLLELANERGVAQDLYTEFQSLVDYYREDEAFAEFMASSAVDDDDRRESIRRIFTGRINEMLLNLMLVLNDHGRAGIVPLVFDRFKKRLDAQSNRQEVHVTSAVPLQEDQRAELTTILSAITGKQAVLVEAVDPTLLGGLIVRVGDQQYNASLRCKLKRFREALADRGGREILAGTHNPAAE